MNIVRWLFLSLLSSMPMFVVGGLASALGYKVSDWEFWIMAIVAAYLLNVSHRANALLEKYK